MRLLFASLMAVTAVAFAAPSFAQDDPTATPTTTTTPTPAAKPAKHKSTASSCSALKSESAKASCLKRTRTAHATTKTPHKTTTKKVAAAKQSSPSQLSPVAEPTGGAPASSGSVSVPPLPQKTI